MQFELRSAGGGQALGAVERLLTCKHKSILTYFQTKVKRIHRRGRKEKFSHELTLIGTNFFDADFADYTEGFGRHAFFGKAFSRSELL